MTLVIGLTKPQLMMNKGNTMKKPPTRPHVPPLLEGPYTPPDDGWFNICLAWFAGYVVCYLVMTL
jgi:hypothetical protein